MPEEIFEKTPGDFFMKIPHKLLQIILRKPWNFMGKIAGQYLCKLLEKLGNACRELQEDTLGTPGELFPRQIHYKLLRKLLGVCMRKL